MAKIEIKTIVTGGDQAAQDLNKTNQGLKNLEGAAASTGREVEGLAKKKHDLINATRGAVREIPILTEVIHALRHPIFLVGTAIGLLVEYFHKLREEMAQADEQWRNLPGKVKVSIDAYSDLKKAADALKTSQEDLTASLKHTNAALDDQIAKLGEGIEQQAKILEAQREVEAAKIERDVADPVERARRLRSNELIFGARIAGMRGSLPGQQAAIVGRQIEEEKRFQVEAGEGIPNEGQLRQQVRGVELTRKQLETARSENVIKGQRYFMLEALKRGGIEEVRRLFPNEAVNELIAEGEQSGFLEFLHGGGYAVNEKKLQPLFAEAGSQRQASLANVARLQSSLRAGLGTLPAGVATEADVSGYISSAETAAAGTQNASYAREISLRQRQAGLLTQQQNTVAINNLAQQLSGIKGDTAIAAAVQRSAEDLARIMIDALRKVGADVKRSSQAAPNP